MMKTLLFITLVILSINLYSQAPSKLPQGLGAKGTRVIVADQMSWDSAAILPKDTIKLLIKDTGALAYKNGALYILKNMGGSIISWQKLNGTISGIPAGSDKQIQFNDGGVLGATQSFTIDKVARMVTIDKASSDSPAISIKQNYTGIKKWMNIQAPVQNDSTLDFGFYSQIAPNDDGTTSNHVLVIGANYDFKNALYGKSGDHWESHWRSGGVLYKERHYVVGLPNFEECRVFSSTFKQRDSLGNSDNTWDFRANVFSLKDVKNNDYFSIGKADNVAGSFSQMTIFGENPIIRISATNYGTNVDLQNVGNALTVSQPILGSANGIFPYSFTARQAFGTSGFSGIALQKANGSNYSFLMNGTTAGSGFANDFYIYDDEHNEMPMRVKANGHFMVNGNGQSDQGQRFQVFGTGLFTDTLQLRNVQTPPSTYNVLVHGSDNNVYETPTSSIGITTLQTFTTPVNNSGTSETDLFSHTLGANKLTVNGQSVKFCITGSNNDATATEQIKGSFAGTGIYDSGALTISSAGDWKLEMEVTRLTSTTAYASVTFSAANTTVSVPVKGTSLSGLDFTTTNIFKCTGTAGGGTGGSNDITANVGKVILVP